MIDGIFTLQISKDIVPDFAMAKIDDFNICDLIFSSPIAPQFLNLNRIFFFQLIAQTSHSE